MDGKQQCLLFAVCGTVCCFTVIYAILFIALWQYKEWVGASLLALIVLFGLVFLRGQLIEQKLRKTRYHHHVETPLDKSSEPVYWQGEFKQNPYRVVNRRTQEESYE
jgi:hypothetical protein